MTGLEIFAWASGGVAAILVLLFASSLWIFAKNDAKSPLDVPNKIQALSAVLALFFGTTAAVGGAVATIQVASLGFELSKQQDYLGRFHFVETKVTRSVDRYTNLLTALSNAYSSAVVVNMTIPTISVENAPDLLEKDAPEGLSAVMEVLADRLLEVKEAINLVLRDDFGHYCFVESVRQIKKENQSKLSYLNNSLKAFGVDPSMLTLSVDNLSDVAAILEDVSRRMKAGKWGDLIEARLFANSSGIDLFGKPYDSANVRTYMTMGKLIFGVANLDSQARPRYIAFFGAAIVHDLILSVPDGERIVDCLEGRYRFMDGEEFAQDISFNPNNVSSGSLLDAIVEAESIGDLYLLVERGNG